jgi:hypothetical protein
MKIVVRIIGNDLSKAAFEHQVSSPDESPMQRNHSTRTRAGRNG